jgi:hypothetical protein
LIPGLPQIPTDNLYKFLAVGFLLLGLLGFGAGFVFQWRGQDQYIELNKLSGRLDATMKEYDRAIKRIDMYQKAAPGSPRVGEAIRAADSIRQVYQQRSEVFDDLFAMIKGQGHRLLDAQFGAWSFGIVATALAALAFGTWYVRHQRFQDRLLTAEVAKVEMEADRLRWEKQQREATIVEVQTAPAEIPDAPAPESRESVLTTPTP